MNHLIFATTISLFLLMDPIGNIPIYLSVLRDMDLKKRQWIILREKIIALAIILLFAFLGTSLLKILGISQESVYIAGGVVLFIMALKMIFPENGTLAASLATNGDPIVFPLAVPLVAGPSVLAAVMIYSSQLENMGTLIISIFIAWLISTIILLCSTYLQRWLGEKGILAIERLMGLILILIAINMFLGGIELFQQLRPMSK